MRVKRKSWAVVEVWGWEDIPGIGEVGWSKGHCLPVNLLLGAEELEERKGGREKRRVVERGGGRK